MPSLAGRSVKSLDLRRIARIVEDAIRQFEPRLTHVRVTPDTERDADEHEFHLRIDARAVESAGIAATWCFARASAPNPARPRSTDAGGR